MDWKESIKWFVLMVAAGVTNAIAIEFVTKRLQEMAVISARAELQRLMMVAASSKESEKNPTTPQQSPQQSHYIA